MDLDLFELTYKTIAKSNTSNVLKAVFLKNHIIQQREFLSEIGNQISEFEDSIRELNNYFNVEKNLSESKETYVCIQFEGDTALFDQYGGDEICGDLIEVIDDVSSKRKNDDGTFYETVSPIGIKLKCQHGELNIAIGDFKNIENF